LAVEAGAAVEAMAAGRANAKVPKHRPVVTMAAPIHFFMMACSSVRALTQSTIIIMVSHDDHRGVDLEQKQARTADLFEHTPAQSCAGQALPAAPMAMMPVAMIAVMTPPPRFGGYLFGIVLNRRGGARARQRQRLGTLRRSGQYQQPANGGKPQNSRHIHRYPPWCHASAGPLIESRSRRDADQARVSNVNVE
jgi:hypothetical protein